VHLAASAALSEPGRSSLDLRLDHEATRPGSLPWQERGVGSSERKRVPVGPRLTMAAIGSLTRHLAGDGCADSAGLGEHYFLRQSRFA
jgi:hypothetical protein